MHSGPRSQSLPQTSVILLVGTDVLGIRQKIQALVESRGGESSCERREYSAAAEEEVSQAIVDAASPSFLAPSRVVILHNLDQAETEQLELIRSYIKRPASDSVLVLISASPPPRNKILKEIFAAVPVVAIQDPKPSQIEAAIQRRFKQAQVSITPDALELLLEHTCKHAEEALAETEKMIAWAGPGGQIDLEMCRILLTAEAEEEVWAVTRAVVDRDPRAALIRLRRLFEQGVDPTYALAVLAGQFRQMLAARLAQHEGIPPDQWSEATGMTRFRLKYTIGDAKRFSTEILERGLARIRQKDRELKSGTSSPEMVLESLVIELSAELSSPP